MPGFDMKRYHSKLSLALQALFALSLVSCNDFLDENPDNRVALDDLERAEQLLVNAYSLASPNFTDWYTDDITEYTLGTEKLPEHDVMYTWGDVSVTPSDWDTPDFFWYATYEAIAHSNEVLAVLDELPVSTEEDVLRKDAIKAEALLTRAYGHFMLVNMFGQHYTGGSSPGVPYITTPETTFLESYERASVRRVYDYVEEDLLEGLELVDDSFFDNSGKYHFNRNAALAFASRFYLYKGDFLRTIQYADLLLGDTPESFIRDLNSEEFALASGSITDYPALYSSPDLAANLLLIRKESLVQRTDFAFGPETNFYGSIMGFSIFADAADQRENPALRKGINCVYPLRYQSLFLRSSLNSNVGTPYYIHLAFTGEEVLLNRAEAHAWLNNTQESLSDLQVLVERRYTGTPVLTLELLANLYNDTDQFNLLSYILFIERRKEFLMQGMRWFDIKRYGFSVSRTSVDGSTITLASEDERKALQLPQSAIDVGDLEPNSR